MGKVTPLSDTSCCGRCGSTPRLDKCKEQTSAKLDVESEGDVIMLSALSQYLRHMPGKYTYGCLIVM